MQKNLIKKYTQTIFTFKLEFKAIAGDIHIETVASLLGVLLEILYNCKESKQYKIKFELFLYNFENDQARK